MSTEPQPASTVSRLIAFGGVASVLVGSWWLGQRIWILVEYPSTTRGVLAGQNDLRTVADVVLYTYAVDGDRHLVAVAPGDLEHVHWAVTVRYDPDEPNRAVVEEAYASPAAIGLAILLGAAFAFVGWQFR
ncbi:MAG: hypothetical protein ACYTG0_19100 [Planctomycetota bacterium]|jgi:hypothetical protein